MAVLPLSSDGDAWRYGKQRGGAEGGGPDWGERPATPPSHHHYGQGGNLTRARVDVVICAPRAVLIHCRAVLHDYANTGIRVQGRLLRRSKKGQVPRDEGTSKKLYSSCRKYGFKRGGGGGGGGRFVLRASWFRRRRWARGWSAWVPTFPPSFARLFAIFLG